MTAAKPANAPPMRKVLPMTRSTLMPINCAATGFCDTARMLFPNRVNFTSRVRPTMMTATTSNSTASDGVKVMGESPSRFRCEISLGTLKSAGPFQRRPTF